MDTDHAVVMTTCANEEDAKPIIDVLLSNGLAACVQVLPINSYYLWKGDVANDSEVLLLIKCKKSKYEKIQNEILNFHKYEIPEIIQLPISDGLDKYLAWIDDPRDQTETF